MDTEFITTMQEILISIICLCVAAVSIIVCSHILLSKDESSVDESEPLQTESTSEEPPRATYSPQSPKSLEFKSLGSGKCAVIGIGGYAGTDLEIPEKSPYGEKVASISAEAFKNCRSLVSVTIPSTVQSIGERAFAGCTSLVLISVDSANPYFSSADAILYSKGKTTLICCPQKRIGSSYLLDPNVRVISPYAFDGVKNLSRILYEGSPAEFEKISIGAGNGDFTSLPITCNYTGTK